MALPPQPLEEVLPQAKVVVLAVVTAVENLAPMPPADRGAPVDRTPDRPPQKVTLEVVRTLRGEVRTQWVVIKPVTAYLLRVGNQGPFLLDGTLPEPHILGRWGPDTYPLLTLENAVAGNVT
jgi:hypothetical protein